MKFIDELDVERVNQTLNFETADCKITGGCDIFTTKPVASDKKLYKTIDHHLETILQENESYKAAVQQQQQLQLQSSPLDINSSLSPTPNQDSRRDSFSFWEQKRRMSITDPLYAINNNIINYNNNFNNNNNSNDSNNSHSNINNSSSNLSNTNNNSNINNNNNNGSIISNNSTYNGAVTSSPFMKSSKINDQNLKGLVTNTESGYTSSSSIDSNSINNSTHRSGSNNNNSTKSKARRTSSNSSLQSIKSPQLRRASLKDADLTVNIGPFGPIREPASRRTFAYLIAILNASYPDHDFSSLEPTDFTKNSLKSFISKFENSLYSLGKKPEGWIWETINLHMTLSDCVVYQFNPTKSFLEDEPGYLWSLIGFLFNKKRKRVAFIYLICSRLKAVSGEFTEDSMKPMRQYTIDYNDGDEGEYDLVNDDENAIADESDNGF